MSFLQMISTIASIISIPLAVYYAHKTADATSDKARLEIIKTLSYKLSIEHGLAYSDIVSVYKSKLREHKIRKATFDIEDIVHDLKSDIMSNAFIDNSIRSEMLLNLSRVFPPQSERVVFGNIRTTRLMYVMTGLLNPIFIVLIIVNVVLFLFNFDRFILIAYETVYLGFYDFHDVVGIWGKFFYYSRLYISVPCLIAWTILIVAQKYISSNNRRS